MSAYFAVVPAAGIGTRFGGNQAKQYAILDGQPVIAHSLQRLLDLDEISHIALVLAAHDEQAALVSAVQNARVSRVAGGAERMDSVLAGLLSLKQARDEDWGLVHDVARPLLRPNDVRELINACAQDYVGGLLAHDVRDTDGVVVTDESAAIERLGHRPRLVLGARDNIKITYADDLALAAFYLSAQRAQGIYS